MPPIPCAKLLEMENEINQTPATRERYLLRLICTFLKSPCYYRQHLTYTW